MSASSEPVVRARADAPRYLFESMGFEVRVLVSTEESGGVQSVMEFCFTTPFDGPPLHWHRSCSETFICLEGTFSVRFEGHTQILSVGDIAHVPPGVLHSYRIDHTPTRYLLICSPGADFEQYVSEAAALVAEAHRTGEPVPMELLRNLRGRFHTYEADVPRF